VSGVRVGISNFRYMVGLCDRLQHYLLAKLNVRYMLSPVRLSVVCNASAPYLGGSNFRQYFYGIMYLGFH